MIDKKLKEAMELLGGRAVIKEQDQYYVLLDLKEFKKIKKEGVEGLTKQELVDKINNDIASWKVMQEGEKLDELDMIISEERKAEEITYEKAA